MTKVGDVLREKVAEIEKWAAHYDEDEKRLLAEAAQARNDAEMKRAEAVEFLAAIKLVEPVVAVEK